MCKISVIVSLLFVSAVAEAQGSVFPHDFAPAENPVKPVEKPYRDDTCLNGLWEFSPVHDKGLLTREQVLHPVVPSVFSWDKTPVRVPSPWNVNSFAREEGGGDFITYPSYPKTWDTTRAGWLMRKFAVKPAWKGRRLILHFDAVAGYTQVYINRRKVAENYEVFLPFEIDITDKVSQSGENELLMWVADPDLLDQPGKYGRRLYVGGSFWGQHINGIWQDVTLMAKPVTYIKSSFVQPFVDKDELRVEATVINLSAGKKTVDVSGRIYPWLNATGKGVIEAPEIRWSLGDRVLAMPVQRITLKPGEERTVTLKVKVEGRLSFWSAAMPNLYGLVMSLDNEGRQLDRQYTRFGWRQFKVVGNKLMLNGQRVVLKGDSWHFMGIPQMTRRYAWAWYTMLKDAHANAVRLHAQPYPQFYLDMADEMGIYVLNETGLWASDGGPREDAEEYWSNAADHVRRFILRDRDHPSVFGWSVCNENIPVAVYVHHSPDSLVKRQLDEINRWVDIARHTDTTRNWISGDGETGAPTHLPVTIGHYGDEHAYMDWSSAKDKLWGIGEGGMAYYGTPRQTSAYNGSRSFVSQQGRMEGVAAEAIHLLNLQKKYDASYRSVFNIVWYGLKPLELGLKDTTRAPAIQDGIFFKKFEAGKPGVQPERLGPYTSTLNPGYDAGLPLYRTWPLFDAIKASNASDDSLAETRAPVLAPVSRPAAAPSLPAKLFSADTVRQLYRLLKDIGVNLVETDRNVIAIIDGERPPVTMDAVNEVKAILAKGGKVLIMGAGKGDGTIINRYLPAPVTFVARRATSFIIENKSALTDGLQNADLYFSEAADQPVAAYGMEGAFADKGSVILSACNTDWKAWNNRPEYSKTISVLRSEREWKPAGNVLVAMNDADGMIYCMTIDPFVLNRTAGKTLRILLQNAGIDFSGSADKVLPAIDGAGTVQHMLVSDSAGDAAQMSGDKNDGQVMYAANDVFSTREAGQGEQGYVYLSFSIYSPRSLSNLLAEPDMPVLNMKLTTQQHIQVYLNKKLVEQSSDNTLRSLPLERGWNRFVLKVRNGGEGRLAIRFDCSDKAFLGSLRSGL